MRGMNRKACAWGLALALAAGLLALPAAAAPADGEGRSWGQVVDTFASFVVGLLESASTIVPIELDGGAESSETPPPDPPPNTEGGGEGGPDWDPNG